MRKSVSELWRRRPALVLLTGVALTAVVTFWFFRDNPKLQEYVAFFRDTPIDSILSSQGEFFGILAAVLAGLLAYANNRGQLRRDEDEKLTTARYWIFYNAANRVRQDHHIVELLSELFKTPGFERALLTSAADLPRGEYDDQRKRDTYVLNIIFLKEGSDESILSIAELVRKQLDNIWQGFINSWKNDDLLERIVFEFSLLDKEEQVQALRYFSRYSEMQDRVTSLSPHLKDKETNGGQSPSLITKRSYEIYLSILNVTHMGFDLVESTLDRNIEGFGDRQDQLSDLRDNCARVCVLPEELPNSVQDSLDIKRYIPLATLDWFRNRRDELARLDAQNSPTDEHT